MHGGKSHVVLDDLYGFDVNASTWCDFFPSFFLAPRQMTLTGGATFHRPLRLRRQRIDMVRCLFLSPHADSL